MKYDRKPDAYSPEPPAPAPVVEDSHAVQESAARAVQNLLQSRPELGDLELYPSDTFAGMGRRLWAFLLDCMIVMPTMLLAAWVLGTFPGQNAADAESVGLFGMSAKVAKAVTKVLQLVLYDMYFTATMHRWGGTWGMKFSGMIVLGRNLAMPSKGQARGRYWATLFSVLPLGLGLLSMLWDKRKRAWHDRIVGTYVVKWDKVPGRIVAAASRATRDAKENSSEEASTLKGLVWLILLVFAPGLIVLGLARLILGKLGIIKSKPKESGTSA